MENIYEYFVLFQREARRAKWPQERIEEVLTKARSDSYVNALVVLLEAMDEIENVWSETAQAELI